MTSRPGACSGCGIPVPATDLVPAGDDVLCPRCYALSTPATLTGGRAARPRPARDGHDPDGHRPGAGADEVGAPLSRLDRSVRRWATGRTWWVRAPVLVWMAWILFRYWDAPWYQTLWKGVDLAVHEIGHILWSPLGELMGVAGGTLTQLLVPVAAGALLYRQRDWFGVAVAVCWLGINCFETVEYAGDAVARRLPLVSPTTGAPMHDWTYLLGRFGLLGRTAQVAEAWQWAGRLIMASGVVFGAWVLWVMAGGAGKETAETVEAAGAAE